MPFSLILASAVAFAAEPEPIGPDTPGGEPPIGPIASGEFRNTAYVTPVGGAVIHPLLKSHYGVSDQLDIKAPILGFLLFGPRGSFEIGLVQSPTFALSIEPEGAINWGFRTRQWVTNARATVMFADSALSVNGGFGTGRFYYGDDPLTDAERDAYVVNTITAPVSADFDLALSDVGVLRIQAGADVYALAQGFTAGTIGVNYSWATSDEFRVALGAAAWVGENPFADIPGLEFMNEWAVLPVPTIEVWWRL